MRPYLEALEHILENGEHKDDRTGTGTTSVFGYQMRFDLSEGFPLVTTKRLHLRSIIHELLWFLKGDTNVQYLRENRVSIWDDWADDNGDLGPIYGKQWRRWEGRDGRVHDQIDSAVNLIRHNPDSRRIVISAWNVDEIEFMALPPCHLLFQFYVSSGKLSCQLYQRSADMFLGVPFNIASYSMLVHMLADHCGLSVGEFIWTGGDCHIYDNHMDQVAEQLSREPYPAPTLRLARRAPSLYDYTFDDFTLQGYEYHPTIKAPVAV
ncbi:MAG: thymidylate synthase [Rhodothermia bacterium]